MSTGADAYISEQGQTAYDRDEKIVDQCLRPASSKACEVIVVQTDDQQADGH